IAGSQLDGKRARERIDRSFAGGVIGLAPAAFLAGNGTDVDDLATALGNHVRNNRAGYVESPNHIGVEHEADVLFFEQSQHIVANDAGVVDQQIDPFSALEQFFREGGTGSGIAHVERLASDSCPVTTGDDLGSGGGILAVGKGHLHTGGSEDLDDGASNPPAAARHDRYSSA